jgi:hypothetical protein
MMFIDYEINESSADEGVWIQELSNGQRRNGDRRL